MPKYQKWLAAVLLSSVPFASFAAKDLSYTYIQGAYSKVELDDSDEDADGFTAAFSGQISDSFFIFAGYGKVESDEYGASNTSVESESISAGLGFILPLTESGSTDLNLTAAYIHREFSTESDLPILEGKVDDEGYGLGARLRHLLTEQIELNASIDYEDIFDEDNTNYSIGALFHLTESLSLGGSYTFGDDADGWGVGVRFHF